MEVSHEDGIDRARCTRGLGSSSIRRSLFPVWMTVASMRHKIALSAALLMMAGLAISAYAQNEQNSPQQPPQQSERGMMGGGMMGGMMGNHEMMGQMSRMMENCNKMMESHMQNHQHDDNQTPDKKG
jgi:hypothetical protein